MAAGRSTRMGFRPETPLAKRFAMKLAGDSAGFDGWLKAREGRYMAGQGWSIRILLVRFYLARGRGGMGSWFHAIRRS